MALCRSLIDIKKKKGTQNRSLRHPILKTLHFRVKTINCYKLISVREAGIKPTIGYILFHNVNVYEAKCYDLQYQMLFANQQKHQKQTFYCLLPLFYYLLP